MVAITVILAAVIGTFVLNLGGNLEQTPQAQLSIAAEDPDGDGTQEIVVNHGGGDGLQTGNLDVQVDGGSAVSTITWGDGTEPFGVGESATVVDSPSGELTVTIIHNPSDSILVERTLTV